MWLRCKIGAGDKHFVPIVAWACLYAAFLSVALLVRLYVDASGAAEIWCWDYRMFVNQIQCWDYISYFGFRHPGLGVVLSPLIAAEHLWVDMYLVFMPTVALFTAILIYRMAGIVGLAIWLIFPTTWLMAAIPESFPMAQLSLVGSIYLLGYKRAQTREGPKNVHLWLVCVLSAVCGMISLTNGLKPILSYFVTCRSRRNAWYLSLVIILIAIGGVSFFFIRSLVCGRNCLNGVAMTLAWIPETRSIPDELYGFFIRPIGVCQSIAVYPLAIYCLVRYQSCKSNISLRVLFAFCFVDIALHLVVGWGMMEPWVFAPHWVFVLPLIIGGRFKVHYNRKLDEQLTQPATTGSGYCGVNKTISCGMFHQLHNR